MRRRSPSLLLAVALGCTLGACDAATLAQGPTGEDDADADDDADGGAPGSDGGGDDDADGGGIDGPDDGGDPPPAPPDDVVTSRCVDDDAGVRCAYETLSLPADVTGLIARDVHFQVPTGPAPAGGFPTVFVFQGSFFSGELAFAAATDDVFGAIHQARLVKALLDEGYAVLAPEAHLDGGTYWDTNVPPWSITWTLSPDHAFMEAIFAAIDGGDFGPLNGDALFATGISSGGFMTSRMAVSYPGRFRALAIHSASYATCSAICVVPSLPEDHPSTLFITGADDVVVPASTALDYEAALRPITETELIVVEDAGHAWLPPAPTAIPAFFTRHR